MHCNALRFIVVCAPQVEVFELREVHGKRWTFPFANASSFVILCRLPCTEKLERENRELQSQRYAALSQSVIASRGRCLCCENMSLMQDFVLCFPESEDLLSARLEELQAKHEKLIASRLEEERRDYDRRHSSRIEELRLERKFLFLAITISTW